MEHVTMVECENKRKPRKLSDYEKALVSINKAYESENYDAYELRLNRAAAKFKKPVWLVEDDATDVRLWGVDYNQLIGKLTGRKINILYYGGNHIGCPHFLFVYNYGDFAYLYKSLDETENLCSP